MSEIVRRTDSPELLLRRGLNLYVFLTPLDGKGTAVGEPVQLVAHLDTGAERGGISPATEARLGIAARLDMNIWTPTHSFQTVDALKCRIEFNGGQTRDTFFAVMQELQPYDVLIGRDLMAEMMLDVDFKSGAWSLSWA